MLFINFRFKGQLMGVDGKGRIRIWYNMSSKTAKNFPFADMTINSNLLRVKFSKCIKSETVQGRKVTEKWMNRYF